MNNPPTTRKGTVIQKIEKSMFIRKDDQHNMNVEGGLRARKLFKPLPPAKQIEAEAQAAKEAQEEEARRLKEAQEEENRKLEEERETSLEEHLQACNEIYRVAFEYDIKLIDIFNDMIDKGMGSEITQIFEARLFPGLEKLMRRELTSLDKNFFVRTLLDSTLVKIVKNRLCGVVAKSHFKEIGNLQWKGMKDYEGDEKTLLKIQDLIKRKLELAEKINDLRNDK